MLFLKERSMCQNNLLERIFCRVEKSKKTCKLLCSTTIFSYEWLKYRMLQITFLNMTKFKYVQITLFGACEVKLVEHPELYPNVNFSHDWIQPCMREIFKKQRCSRGKY